MGDYDRPIHSVIVGHNYEVTLSLWSLYLLCKDLARMGGLLVAAWLLQMHYCKTRWNSDEIWSQEEALVMFADEMRGLLFVWRTSSRTAATRPTWEIQSMWLAWRPQTGFSLSFWILWLAFLFGQHLGVKVTVAFNERFKNKTMNWQGKSPSDLQMSIVGLLEKNLRIGLSIFMIETC